MRSCIVVFLALLAVGCSSDRVSRLPGFHWHHSGLNDETYLIRDDDGTVACWGFTNEAGTFTMQANFNALSFNRDFLTRRDAEAFVESHPSVLGTIPDELERR